MVVWLLVKLLLILYLQVSVQAAPESKTLPGSEECAGCHDPGRRTGKREAGVPPAYHEAALKASPHASLECSSCHSDTDPKQLPHAEKLTKVECGNCHADQQSHYDESLHGKALSRGDKR